LAITLDFAGANIEFDGVDLHILLIPRRLTGRSARYRRPSLPIVADEPNLTTTTEPIQVAALVRLLPFALDDLFEVLALPGIGAAQQSLDASLSPDVGPRLQSWLGDNAEQFVVTHRQRADPVRSQRGLIERTPDARFANGL
jgi:hypothetical protein